MLSRDKAIETALESRGDIEHRKVIAVEDPTFGVWAVKIYTDAGEIDLMVNGPELEDVEETEFGEWPPDFRVFD
ncbi:MAG: hypothetical protein GWO40_04675 [Gammaproteobacteria bacterium]|nr:hypothetical protein [Gemmatimonadota bacterium]NIR82445.1 hypothetical protein [Gammaproteobacteria bacterium]NIU03581.1 hypothetical protein [Gammaproteobacteria bacterium]NIX84855.1 hypothetical protein [Gammaproteobacteria bacterium]